MQNAGDEKAQLKSDEGERLTAYKDSLGNVTVGVGHKVIDNDKIKLGDQITQERSNQLFDSDYEQASEHAQSYGYSGPEANNILTNMVFQMGKKGVDGFTGMHKALKEGNYSKAADEMLDSKWAKEQTQERAQRLADRMRKIE